MIQPGLTIKIVDPDPDYFGIEIHASNERFAGSTRVYAGLEELSEFAARVGGFPTNADDERVGPGTAHLRIRFEAAALDQFTNALREIEQARSGEATLPSCD